MTESHLTGILQGSSDATHNPGSGAMSDRFQADGFDDLPLEVPQLSNFAEPSPPFPAWLAARFLRPDEKITWVRGPRFNPSWELYVTHPVLLLAALALGALCVLAAWRVVGAWSEMPVWPFVAEAARDGKRARRDIPQKESLAGLLRPQFHQVDVALYQRHKPGQ